MVLAACPGSLSFDDESPQLQTSFLGAAQEGSHSASSVYQEREAFWGSLWVSHVDGGLAGLPSPPRASVSVPGVTPRLCWGGLCSVWALEVGAAGPRGLRCHPRCGSVPTVWVWPGGGLSYAFLPAVMFTGSVKAHGALHDGHQRPGWLVEREPCLVPTRRPPGQSSGSDVAP